MHTQNGPLAQLRNRSFSAFLGTQFLGAFHDNLFKQALLLFAVFQTSSDRQGIATIVFTLPFVLVTSWSGQLAEMISKTRLIRAVKALEVALAAAALLAWHQQSFTLLLVVLFGFGLQSAIFAPAKYSVIPELVAAKRLVAANGLVHATSFAAVIGGTAIAGYLMNQATENRLVLGLTSVLIALTGLCLAFAIQPVEAQRPQQTFDAHPFRRLGIHLWEIWRDPLLAPALLFSAVFWFSGVWVILIVNHTGRHGLGLNPNQISQLLVIVALGVMLGCASAAWSVRRLGLRFTMALSAILVVAAELLLGSAPQLNAVRVSLMVAGLGSGLYIVPLLTILQQRPALGSKGEILAAMTFVNYASMLVAGVLWAAWTRTPMAGPYAWWFLAVLLVVLCATRGTRLLRELRSLNLFAA